MRLPFLSLPPSIAPPALLPLPPPLPATAASTAPLLLSRACVKLLLLPLLLMLVLSLRKREKKPPPPLGVSAPGLVVGSGLAVKGRLVVELPDRCCSTPGPDDETLSAGLRDRGKCRPLGEECSLAVGDRTTCCCGETPLA